MVLLQNSHLPSHDSYGIRQLCLRSNRSSRSLIFPPDNDRQCAIYRQTLLLSLDGSHWLTKFGKVYLLAQIFLLTLNAMMFSRKVWLENRLALVSAIFPKYW